MEYEGSLKHGFVSGTLTWSLGREGWRGAEMCGCLEVAARYQIDVFARQTVLANTRNRHAQKKRGCVLGM